MSRRVSLPGADELFRTTRSRPGAPTSVPTGGVPADDVAPAPSQEPRQEPQEEPEQPAKRGPSGRVRHDEKITVYVTADELLDLEDIRLALRRQHGLAVDRGRIVREAIHLVIEAVEAEGDESPLVRRLREQ